MIEPIGAAAKTLTKLYDIELMLGGGHVAGYAVDAAHSERAVHALQALARPQVFAKRYGVPAETPPMLFAVGDGNHSLATAKSIWDQLQGFAGHGPPQPLRAGRGCQHPRPGARIRADPPPAVRRVVPMCARHWPTTFGSRLTCTDVASAAAMRQRVQDAPDGDAPRRRVGRAWRAFQRGRDRRPAPPRCRSVPSRAFVDGFIEQGGGRECRLRARRRGAGAPGNEPAGNAGIHLAAVGKSQLLKRVVREGPLPRKAFSMGGRPKALLRRGAAHPLMYDPQQLARVSLAGKPSSTVSKTCGGTDKRWKRASLSASSQAPAQKCRSLPQ